MTNFWKDLVEQTNQCARHSELHFACGPSFCTCGCWELINKFYSKDSKTLTLCAYPFDDGTVIFATSVNEAMIGFDETHA